MSPESPTPALLGLMPIAAFVVLVGCDQTSAYENCTATLDPGATPGRRVDACPESLFPSEDYRSREVAGIVRRGEEMVAGATVRVSPSPGFASPIDAVASTVTNAGGGFTGLRAVALRYDLSVSYGTPEVADAFLFYRGLGNRYIEPALEGPHSFPRAWIAHVDVRLDAPTPPDRSLAFFVGGDGVYSVEGDVAHGLTVLTRDYSASPTLHVVEYTTAGGFASSTRYGKVDFQSSPADRKLVGVGLADIVLFAMPTFAIRAPSGISPSTVDIRFNFGRTSDAVLASVPIGTTPRLPVIPDAGFTYRVSTTNAGAVSDTGEVAFDILQSPVVAEMPAPPVVASPADGDARRAGEPLVVNGEGILEHVLVPQNGGPAMRIVTANGETPIPDLTAFGRSAVTGSYTWTVRSYPKALLAEDLAGLDTRRYRAAGTSSPRTLVLR